MFSDMSKTLQKIAQSMENNNVEWCCDEFASGILLLAKSKVHYSGIPFNPFNMCFTEAGVWLIYNKNEALLLEAPFIYQEKDIIIPKIEEFLSEKKLHLKFITVSHLHRDHAEGLSALLEYFTEATFVYPNSWTKNWRSFPKNIDPPGFQNKFNRQYNLGYTISWCGDLAGEQLQFFQAPYHSLTDQVISFRGTAILPDWHLPSNINEHLKFVDAPVHEIKKTLQLLKNTSIHSSISVHGEYPVSHDFQYRLNKAIHKFGA